ncbi:MAG: type II secretion system protein GspL [Ectothiorhodospiraceae bacterium]|jgi:general secretion pathway protein L|nr:type II secretion system protein GspL [Ectothiorhodospiraceae bacterium]
MAKLFILRLEPAAPVVAPPDLPVAEAELRWAALESRGAAPLFGRGDASDAMRAALGARVVVLVPGSEVLLAGAEVPSRNPRKLMQALPYALEDRLSEDVEDLHFAISARHESGPLPVAIVARRQMDAWLARLRDAGITPQAMIPDLTLADCPAGAWRLLLDGREAWLVTGPQQGQAMEREQTAMMLDLALTEADEAKPALLHVVRAAGVDAEDAALDEVLARHAVETRHERLPSGLFESLVRDFDERRGIDLLQGPYGRRERLEQLWRPWLPAAALLLVWLLVQGAIEIVRIEGLKNESLALDRQMESLYLEAFPGSRVVDPRTQMQHGLAELRAATGGGGGDFQRVLAATGPVLGATSGLHIQALRYRPGQLDVDLEVKDLQTLDLLKQRLAQGSGWEVDIQSASARGDKVESRLLIRRPGA